MLNWVYVTGFPLLNVTVDDSGSVFVSQVSQIHIYHSLVPLQIPNMMGLRLLVSCGRSAALARFVRRRAVQPEQPGALS